MQGVQHMFDAIVHAGHSTKTKSMALLPSEPMGFLSLVLSSYHTQIDGHLLLHATKHTAAPWGARSSTGRLTKKSRLADVYIRLRPRRPKAWMTQTREKPNGLHNT